MGACGLPEARKNHVIAICRFAKDIVNKMNLLVRDLEVELGPDTAELGIRVGIHSGQVTAGVLRGERARFQLFGDTVNTASRMESTGAKNQVQISEETKECLVLAGKGHWATARADKIIAKGKGELQTYWLSVGAGSDMTSRSSGRTENTHDIEVNIEEVASGTKLTRKDERLVQWNVEVLVKVLKRIAARRQLLGVRPDTEGILTAKERSMTKMSTLVVDELKEVITLPEWQRSKKAAVAVELDPLVSSQLYDFVSNLALLYRDNAFSTRSPTLLTSP
jgi:Adenylate and Guanylate cyclase catalytic domain